LYLFVVRQFKVPPPNTLASEWKETTRKEARGACFGHSLINRFIDWLIVAAITRSVEYVDGVCSKINQPR